MLVTDKLLGEPLYDHASGTFSVLLGNLLRSGFWGAMSRKLQRHAWTSIAGKRFAFLWFAKQERFPTCHGPIQHVLPFLERPDNLRVKPLAARLPAGHHDTSVWAPVHDTDSNQRELPRRVGGGAGNLLARGPQLSIAAIADLCGIAQRLLLPMTMKPIATPNFFHDISREK